MSAAGPRRSGARSVRLRAWLSPGLVDDAECAVLRPPRISAQVEGQADRARPDEGCAEGGVRGQVDRGDAHEHAEVFFFKQKTAYEM